MEKENIFDKNEFEIFDSEICKIIGESEKNKENISIIEGKIDIVIENPLNQYKNEEVEKALVFSTSELPQEPHKSSDKIEEIIKEELKIKEKSMIIKEESANTAEKNYLSNAPVLLNPYELKAINELNFTPELASDSKFLPLNEKTFPIFGISPIKSIMSVDDYSDIVAALASPDQEKLPYSHIPDLFIRATQKPKQLPMLKPATPYYFSKKSAVPRMRKENKIFLDKLKLN